MAKSGKTRSFLWLALKSVVAGSVVMTRTFAAPTPVTPNHAGMVDDWRAVAQQLGHDPSSLPPLNDTLVDMITAANLDKDLSDAVLATYEMVDQTELRALDAHWASVLTAAGNAALVVEFLNLRSGLANFGGIGQESDAVLWLANSSPHQGCDGCNSGNGNGPEPGEDGDDCDPGNSGDNNNGKD